MTTTETGSAATPAIHEGGVLQENALIPDATARQIVLPEGHRDEAARLRLMREARVYALEEIVAGGGAPALVQRSDGAFRRDRPWRGAGLAAPQAMSTGGNACPGSSQVKDGEGSFSCMGRLDNSSAFRRMLGA